MPIYTFQNPENEIIEVMRSMKDIDVEPNSEETDLQGPWTRILSSDIGVKKTAAWGRGKGLWGADQKIKKSYIGSDGKIRS